MRLSFFPPSGSSTTTYRHRCRTKLFSPVQMEYCHYHATAPRHQRRKIVVIMGPTGCGKSRLSIDLATRFFPSEVINSDKIQVYRGLDITTNKIPMPDRRGVPHHLLGEIVDRHLTPSEYRSLAARYVSSISDRRKLPLVVGGSNSFIHALVANRFDPDSDVFHETEPDPVSKDLRYNCCFLWVDVAIPVLNQYLEKRVDEMLDSGMFEELEEYFDSGEFRESGESTGLRQAIGVPEFEPYFRKFPSHTIGTNHEVDSMRRAAYEEAVRAIKENTCQLAKRQAGKIQRLRGAGWDLRRLDATEVFRAAMGGLGSGSDSACASGVWERQVVEPSVKIVKRFMAE
ncbi:hypothetical protein RHSIM_Rhsim09G0107100 [Rhododendron simsii]|uniref:Adenylate isopentenyltransferase n=1 Tax=Rhododendron simsii TaxID=118357 RepID=A0A834GKQ0_RHOSS|nr:hypothetical protein RHSIM_Rhsim09G0107100 [Rhododendron simsii]